MIIRFDFPETASSALYIVHAAENVGYYGIAASGSYLVRIQVLHQRAVEHSAGRIDFHPAATRSVSRCIPCHPVPP